MLIGFLSDVHEDVESLKKALKLLERAGCDALIALGDMTGAEVRHLTYLDTRNAADVIRILTNECRLVVRGNHDLFAIRAVPEARFGFDYPDNWYDLDYQDRKRLGQDAIWLYEHDELPTLIGAAEKELIRRMPEWSTLEADGIRMSFSHYLYPDLTGSSNILPPNKNLCTSHLAFSENEGVDVSFFGHLHPEGHWRINQKTNQLQSWGRSSLADECQAIGVPAVCRGSNRNGVLIFDTVSKEISTQKIPGFRF